MAVTYRPDPIDTSDVELPASLGPLMEKLARNTHELWAQQRLEDGWTYGPDRNDRLLQHNCLVPYEQLPDSEQQYDRITSRETLKLILKLGYQILPPSQTRLTDIHRQQLDALHDAVTRQANTLASLLQLWQSHEPDLWRLRPSLYLSLGCEFLKRGEPLLAYDVFNQALKQLPEDSHRTPEQQSVYTGLCQQQALALAETGAVNEASQLLHKLLSQKDTSLTPETLGLLGRTYKEMARSTDTQTQKRHHLQQAFDVYHQAYQQSRAAQDWNFAYYTGINAATVALMAGQSAQSGKIAAEVSALCRKLLAENPDDDAPYWLHASLGEAELLRGNNTEAISAYRAATIRCRNDQRALISMRKQLLWLTSALDGATSELLSLFPVPTIVIFNGHRLDHPDAKHPQFPADNEPGIQQAIGDWLDQFDHIVAYSAAASGCDQIFIEQVLARGGEVNIILPFDQDSFQQTSVSCDPEDTESQRYRAVLARATRVVMLAEYHPEVSAEAVDFTQQNILGMARARANASGYHLRGLTVWSGSADNNPGSTDSAVRHWQGSRLDIDRIDSLTLATSALTPLSPGTQSHESMRMKTLDQGVGYYNYLPMLFADVKGYSKLNELQLVAFSTRFLDCIKSVFDRHNEGIFTRRTQGDGLFVVFRSLSVAALFALDLNQAMADNDWGAIGLPEDLMIRISLDAGPCYTYLEPITGTTEFCGQYVNRAARLEPITPPGHIYASETFVALAHANGLHDIRFVYTGLVVLPKGHGTIPAYHLREHRK
jgi:class 3 adenylate cyclase